MLSRTLFWLVPAAVAASGACSYQGPSLQGYQGLQRRVISYYDANAVERAAVCPNPAMQSITASDIVERTPERVVMDIRYYWIDWSQATDLGSASITTCRDWASRTFTFAPDTSGNLQVVDMSGPKKG